LLRQLPFGKVREDAGDDGERTVDKVNVVHKKTKTKLNGFHRHFGGSPKGRPRRKLRARRKVAKCVEEALK